MPVVQFPKWEFDPSTMRVKVDVSLNADKTNISGVVENILGLMKAMECACGKEFEVETALREALANAIVHGCGNDAKKKIQCTVACDDEDADPHQQSDLPVHVAGAVVLQDGEGAGGAEQHHE